jgi:hypothetical protein
MRTKYDQRCTGPRALRGGPCITKKEEWQRTPAEPDPGDSRTQPNDEPTTMQDLREALAAIEHQRWADWQRWLHSQATMNHPECTLTIAAADVDRWERQIATPYVELSQEEKDSDREQVDRYLPAVVAFVDQWLKALTTYGFNENQARAIAALWRSQAQIRR